MADEDQYRGDDQIDEEEEETDESVHTFKHT